MKKFIASISVALVLTACSAGDTDKAPEATGPEAVGMSSERLAALDGYMQRYVDDELLAGLQLLVSRRGETVYFNTIGMAEIDSNTPMADDSIFRIYSMTKPITSVAVMMMYEEGKFLLTDPVSKYLPEMAKLRVYESGEGDDM